MQQWGNEAPRVSSNDTRTPYVQEWNAFQQSEREKGKKENWVEEKREGEREKSIMQRKNPTETVLMGRIPTFVTPAELRMGWKIKRNELSERGWGKWKQFQTTVHEPFRPGSNQRAEPGRPAVSTFEGESSPTWKGGKVQGVRDSPAKRVW